MWWATILLNICHIGRNTPKVSVSQGQWHMPQVSDAREVKARESLELRNLGQSGSCDGILSLRNIE